MKITPLRTNITLFQGGTLDERFLVYDDETGLLADLTGYTGDSEICTASADDSGDVELTPQVIVDVVNSIVQIYNDTVADTRGVTVPTNGWHLFDVFITGAGGDRWKVAYGQVAVVPEISRPS